jgi:FixJ family two-component response regulator
MSDPVVHIVEDDDAVCDSLSLLCETAGLSARCYSSPEAFLHAECETLQGCIVLDVRLPKMSGLQLHEELRRRGSRLPVIYLTAHGDIPMTVRAMKLGATDFLTKPVNAAAFVERVRAIVEQRTASPLADTSEVAARLATLTAREREVMRLAIDGLSNKEIGRRLAISFRTVEIHRSRIMKKTACANLLGLARLVGDAGVTDDGESREGSEGSNAGDAS